ncbi:lysine N(6)-hydroxylase/L-ornithine N(5)-oxygenase family protein [Yinghuangia seranimata]|uniref:lysine N(6)-hydroxylase/L-ornithine N(5)-oxygenase family protein n=1 Tax=Yinghuangia seranimata TaxID=408067 RepID=UPI00248CFE6F|nr:SidA/IucD/PvdA family monooxygenase [Yinghuangia seranimata]MDI2128357.1 SidA/IucD/PvdA family monooxygenase [Yinghuangia seranimata]
MGERALDFVAVGAGPANLSLAALAKPHEDLEFRVLERHARLEWHPGLMVAGAALQVDPIKDLVRMVDPTSPYSFTAFLRDTGRLHRALVAHRSGVSRQEFAQYYRWAASQWPEVELDREVEAVEVNDDGDFLVRTRVGAVPARNVVLGVGRAPHIPEPARALLGPRVFHASEYLRHRDRLRRARVLVVGGGQSAAEVVLDLIRRPDRPSGLTWVTGRSGLLPLDDSPFANEWYNPSYAQHFNALGADQRRRLLSEQVLSSDGVSADLLQQIYARLYELDYLVDADDRVLHRVLPGHRLAALTSDGPVLHARLTDTAADADHEPTTVQVDAVVLATGYTDTMPALLEPLADRIAARDGRPDVQPDYRLAWDGPPDRGIYVQNAARPTHGVADPNLSLNAWRSAVILNSLSGGKRYDLSLPDTTIALH